MQLRDQMAMMAAREANEWREQKAMDELRAEAAFKLQEQWSAIAIRRNEMAYQSPQQYDETVERDKQAAIQAYREYCQQIGEEPDPEYAELAERNLGQPQNMQVAPEPKSWGNPYNQSQGYTVTAASINGTSIPLSNVTIGYGTQPSNAGYTYIPTTTVPLTQTTTYTFPPTTTTIPLGGPELQPAVWGQSPLQRPYESVFQYGEIERQRLLEYIRELEQKLASKAPEAPAQELPSLAERAPRKFRELAA